MDLYPLIDKHPEIIRSKTGKTLDDVNLQNIINGNLKIEDISISRGTLMMQAQVALEAGREQLARNFVRAAELIEIPDDEILRMYDALRPNRSTEEELKILIEELESKYNAPMCAEHVRETLEVYKKRDMLK